MPIFVDTVFVDTFLTLWKCNKKNISGDSEFFDGNKKISCSIYLAGNLAGTISPTPTWEIHCRVMGLLNLGQEKKIGQPILASLDGIG